MKKILFLVGLVAFIFSCNTPSDNSMSNKEADNRARFQRFYDDVMNAHNVAMIDSFCTTDFVDHNPSPGHSGKGLDDLHAMFNEMLTAFPDLKATTNFIVAKEDTVVAYVTMSGTNTGPMGTTPPTNKPFKINGIDIIVVKDGKATERWGVFEDLSMMTQLGMGAPADASK